MVLLNLFFELIRFVRNYVLYLENSNLKIAMEEISLLKKKF